MNQVPGQQPEQQPEQQSGQQPNPQFSQQPFSQQPEQQPMSQQPIYQQPVYQQPVYQQQVFAGNQVSPETQGAASTAMILEIILGLFGMLGIGHVYSQRKGLGIGLMIGWWGYMLIAALISAGTFGLGFCMTVPIYIAGPIISGLQARSFVQKTGGIGSWKSVGMVIAMGVVGLLVLVMIVVLGIMGATQL